MILFILAVLGMAFIVVESSLFAGIREYAEKNLHPKCHKLVTCLQCFGFWAGLFIGWLIFNPELTGLFVYGCAGSFLSMAAGIVLHLLENL